MFLTFHKNYFWIKCQTISDKFAQNLPVRGMNSLSGEASLSKSLSPFWKRVYSKRNQESEKEDTKVISLLQNGRKSTKNINLLNLYLSLGIFSRQQNNNIFSYFFPENRLWHSMQIVSKRDNLHEMTKPIFWRKKKKKKKKKNKKNISKCCLLNFFTQNAKH